MKIIRPLAKRRWRFGLDAERTKHLVEWYRANPRGQRTLPTPKE